MLIDNKIFLRANYPVIYEQMKTLEEEIYKSFVQLEDTRNGEKTLTIEKDDRNIYLHSKYDPLREASTILQQFEVKEKENISKNTHVIFYGVGLGYHIDLFLQKYTDISFSIYEPIEDILYHYLSNKNLKQMPLKNLNYIAVGNNKEDSINFFKEIMKNRAKKTIVFPLPSYEKNFNQYYEEFLVSFKDIVKNERISLHTNSTFQGRWITNSMRNFKEILKTPNILLSQKGEFNDKPAILVSAGPSLDEEIENLKYIKEKGLAYIFSVGSAINTLIHHNIHPHAACTYDPSNVNMKVFQKIVEENIKDIPLIFGSSVAFEVLQNYPGKKLHMITSQDTTAAYYLKAKSGEKIECVMDAPSIAVVTLELLYKLGFGKIILVGQNLGYRENKNIATGIDYHQREVDVSKIKNPIKVKDVYGNNILTNDSFNNMRRQMEGYIKKFNGVEIINTTKGGVHIEGTKFTHLEELIKNEFEELVISNECLLLAEGNYDIKYIEQQMLKMKVAYKSTDNLIKEVRKILNNIEKLCRNRNLKQAEKMHNKLDDVFQKIKANDYFTTFVIPRNRVKHKILLDEIADITREKNKIKKSERIINSFGKWLYTCEKDMKNIDNLLRNMHEEIEKYINNEEYIEDSSINGEENNININNSQDSKEAYNNIGKKEKLENNTSLIEIEKNIIFQAGEEHKSSVKNLFVKKEDTIKYTMEVIDKIAKRIALVIDKEEKLIGTVTDGDIRRAILNGVSLEDAVENIMNKKFVFVGENYSEKFIKNIFMQKSVFQIPVLDEEMKVIDMVYYQDLVKKTSKENWAVIMAGGLGTRLHPLTNDKPKPMLKIGSKPILEIIIEQLREYGYRNILLCVNYKSNIIENYFQDGTNFNVNIQYIKENKPLGTAGSIKLAKKYLDKPFFVVNGDILTKLNFEKLMEYHKNNENKITMAVRKHEIQIPYGVLEIKEEDVKSIQEKPISSMFINGGIYCLDPAAIYGIPDDEYFNITQLIERTIEKKERVGSFPITEYWMDIGQLEDYQQANVDYEILFRSEACGSEE